MYYDVLLIGSLLAGCGAVLAFVKSQSYARECFHSDARKREDGVAFSTAGRAFARKYPRGVRIGVRS